jgi:hypothetical protein
MAEPIDHERFVTLLKERYPAIAADIDDCARGLLHLEMGTLARATQAAISDEDKAAVRGYFAFIADVFRLATPDVKNAIYVSFLENLSFDGRHGNRIGARELLSPQLQTALMELEKHNAEIFG